MNMNQSRRQPAATTTPTPNATPRVEQDFEQLEPQTPMIDHLTIPGFIRRIPNRWHLEDITRFGDKVGRTAEALQLSYMTTVDRSLGVIRVFPVPLLQRVYDILAAQFGWPKIIELATPALEDPRRVQQETLRSHERLEKHLRTVLAAAEETDVQHSIAVVLQWLQQDTQRIREQLGPQAETTARA